MGLDPRPARKSLEGSTAEAQDAWQVALARVDPDSDVTKEAWLAAHFYYWVADAWVMKGSWVDAGEVLRMIPLAIQDRVDEHYHARSFRSLRERVVRLRDDERIRLAAWLAMHSDRPGWELAGQLWQEILAIAPDISTPASLQTKGDNAQLAWNLRDYYVEVEVSDIGAFEWFAVDRRTHNEQSGAWEKNPVVPAELASWLVKLAFSEEDEE